MRTQYGWCMYKILQLLLDFKVGEGFQFYPYICMYVFIYND